MEASSLDHAVVLEAEYVLEDKLGDTTGEVFRARAKRDARVVVVRKLAIPQQPLAAEFLQLAQTASRVRHPTLANVEAYGRDEAGGVFLVAEYVAGQSLDEWADEVGIPPLGQVIELVRRLCLGLQAAARSGVTHDALNPRNVLVTQAQGTGPRLPIKLLDLGVPAYLRAAEPGGHAVRFMSPEQLQVWTSSERRQGFRCSAVMNVYSCGCLLYFLCTGGPPYAGVTVEELLAAQAAGRLAPPQRINPQISAALNGLILRALSLDPSERFATVGELADALTGVVGSLQPFMRASVPNMPAVRAVPSIASALEADEPTTFKTARPPELRVDAVDPAAHDVPTLPPGPPSDLLQVPPLAADAGAAVAPIGLFSSAPPWQDRKSPTPPPPNMSGERGPPLALFSPLPPSRESAITQTTGIILAQGEPIANQMLGPYDLAAADRAQRHRRLKSGLLFPLALVVCLAVYFGVQQLATPPELPIATVAPAANGSGMPELNDNVRVAVAPVANTAAPLPHEPENETGAVRPEERDQFAPSEGAQQLASAERSREHSHGHRSREPRTSNGSGGPAANAETKELTHAELLLPEVVPVPPAHDPDASLREHGVAPSARADNAVRPAATEATTPKPKPSVAKPSAPALPLEGRAQILSVEVRGSLPTSIVRRAVERIRGQLSACYTRSAQAAGHNGFGEVSVTVELDEHGRARSPHARGGLLPELDGCIAGVATKLISEKVPDTGTVSASWKVVFTP